MDIGEGDEMQTPKILKGKAKRNYGEQNMAYLSTGSNTQRKTGRLNLDDARFIPGAASANFKPMGLINIDTDAVGTDAGTDEKDLITFSLPANSLNANGKVVRITAWGSVAANGNTKTIKMDFGATTITQIGPAAISGLDWKIEGLVIRTGETTQDAIATEMLDVTAQDTTITIPTEDETGAVIIKITGENGTAAANDIVAKGMMIEFLN